jgi:hypothetical protein
MSLGAIGWIGGIVPLAMTVALTAISRFCKLMYLRFWPASSSTTSFIRDIKRTWNKGLATQFQQQVPIIVGPSLDATPLKARTSGSRLLQQDVLAQRDAVLGDQRRFADTVNDYIEKKLRGE